MALEAFFTKKAFDLVRELGEGLVGIRRERQVEVDTIESICGPLENLVPFYVEPDGQNVNPADLMEDDTGLIAAVPIFAMLDKFLVGQKRFTHAFILSDAGMGKTSLLVMLKLAYLKKFILADFRVELLKLGKETLQEIKNIKNPGRTVLLLDALDEDPEAWANFHNRIGALLRSTQNFRKVVISCRTQFFPREHEEDVHIPGIIKLHGFYCAKLFLSPFDNDKVYEYLRRRFKKTADRKKAQGIIDRMSLLKFRPMLLAHIDLLIGQNRDYETAFEVYQAMVEAWLDREVRKEGETANEPIVPVDEKNVLKSACMVVAKYLYDSNKPWISKTKLEEILNTELFHSIDSMKIGGRSLLNRTSEGHFKFAHLSIMEFFITTAIYQGWRPASKRYTDQVKSFIVNVIKHHNSIKIDASSLPDIFLPDIRLDYVNLVNVVLVGANLERVDLTGTNLAGVSLERVNLTGAIMTETNLERVRLRGAILTEAILTGVDLRGTDMIGVNLERADLTRAKLMLAVMKGANLKRANLAGADLEGANLVEANLAGANLTGVNLVRVNLVSSIMEGANLEGAYLEGAYLAGAKLAGIRWTGAKLAEANMKGTDWKKAKLAGANLEGAILY